MFLIYSGCCIFSFIIVYLYIPETKGIPVEEIGDLFGDRVAVHLTAEGNDVIEKEHEVQMIENLKQSEVGDNTKCDATITEKN